MGEVSEPLSAPDNLLWLVVPVYRPGQEFSGFLPQLAAELQATGWRHVIQVVDDGNRNEHRRQIADTCGELQDVYPSVRDPVVLEKNSGKGAAIKAGWGRADADAGWLAFVDADGSVSASEVVRVCAALFCTGDSRKCVIASRLRILGRQIDRKWHRHAVGRVFSTLTSCLLNLHAYDTQCGFKIIPRDAFEAVRPRLEEDRFTFDVELVCELRAAAFNVVEEAVDWSDRGESTVRLWRDVPAMFAGLLRIRRRMTERRV